ncbi:MAG: histidinol dehydrogenase [Solirubrobacterales bacterium]
MSTPGESRPLPRRIRWDGEDAATMAAGLRGQVSEPASVAPTVTDVIAQIRARGDDAVRELSRRYDTYATERIAVPRSEPGRALSALDPSVAEALELAAANIRAVAEAQIATEPTTVELPQGHGVTVREVAVGRAAVYAPGGRAAYPSSVLMAAIPALAAGVGQVAVTSPPSESGLPHPVVLAACAIAGIEEVYAMGGAQAIAALALGTETVPAVDVIAGPGNRFVTEAKRQLVGQVGIDGIAGPSELLTVLTGGAEARLAALDLAAQAEHGPDSLLVAASDDASLLDEVADHLTGFDRPSITGAPTLLVEVPDIGAALDLANALAPEHLQLMGAAAEARAVEATTAGCVFAGNCSGTAFGDYAAGSNHVLPTGGAARFSGPLGPGTFRRRQSVVSLPGSAARALAPIVGTLARAEGLPVHGESAEERS